LTPPTWIAAAVGSVIAAVLAIVVGVKLFEMMVGETGSTASPSILLPTPSPSPSVVPTAMASATTPIVTPNPTKTLNPTPTPRPVLSTISFVGGPLAGDHPVYTARAFVEDGYLKVALEFQVRDDLCRIVFVLFLDAVDGPQEINKQAKGEIVCPTEGAFGLIGGSIDIVRDGTISGEFDLRASSAGELFDLTGEFDPLPIEGL
jgi:hypothetical protein